MRRMERRSPPVRGGAGSAKPPAQGLGHAAAAVHGGAAAQSHDQAPGAGADGGEHQFADAEGGGPARVPPGARHELQSGGRGHLDDGGAGIQQSPAGDYGLAAGAGHGTLAVLPAEGGHESVHGAFAAVGDRADVHLGVRQRATHAVGHGGGGLRGGQAFLVAVGCADDLHAGVHFSSVRPVTML